MNYESELWSGAGTTGANYEPNVEQKNRLTESCRTNGEEVIAKEVKSTVKDLVANVLSTMIKESLDEILPELLYNVQDCIQSVVNNIVEQVMLDLKGKEVIADTLDANIENLLDTYAGVSRL